jgi:hypothetical protein
MQNDLFPDFDEIWFACEQVGDLLERHEYVEQKYPEQGRFTCANQSVYYLYAINSQKSVFFN